MIRLIAEFEVDTEIFIRTAVMLVGLACLYYAGAWTLRRRRIRRDPVRVLGEVVALEVDSSKDGSDWYVPTVRYGDESGAKHEAKLSIVRDNVAYAVGSNVPVVYERGNPTNLVDPNDGWAETIALTLIAGFGLIVVLMGASAEVGPAD